MNQKDKIIVGGVVIGIVELIGGLFGMIICSVFLGKSELRLKHANIFDDKIWVRQTTDFLVFLLVVSIIQTLVSSVLIGGILKESTKALLAWMIIKCLFIGLLLISIIWSLVDRNFAPVAIDGTLFIINTSYVLFIRFLRLKLLPESTSPEDYNKLP